MDFELRNSIIQIHHSDTKVRVADMSLCLSKVSCHFPRNIYCFIRANSFDDNNNSQYIKCLQCEKNTLLFSYVLS